MQNTKMSHREVLQALSGLLLGMFISMLASTVVSTSLPVIISELKGSQSSFTWVVTATLLATTVSTPLWGKFADLTNRKILIQAALIIFALASAIASFSTSPTLLIAMRVLQGLGAGGLAALSQIVMADILSPRERGKYAGLFAAVMAVATVGGPLLGGVITDSLDWRWNFLLPVPLAVVAIILLQKTLHLPKREPVKLSIDYWGIAGITAGFSLLLIWVSLGGQQFAWSSGTSYLMLGTSLLIIAAAMFAETRAADPIIPLKLFKDRTFTLSVVASISVGVSMFGTSVYLSQYMQLARGASPTESGLMTIPMMAGLLISSTIIGALVTKSGRWKGFLVGGSVLMVVGSYLLSNLHYNTPFFKVAVSMFILGAGMGILMQNLVVIVQNKVSANQMGVATSSVTFFRTLGGTIGVSALGAVLGASVSSNIRDGVAALPLEQQQVAANALGSGSIPKIAELPDFLRIVVETAYGTGTGKLFLAAIPLTLVTLFAVLFIPNAPLGTKNVAELLAEESDTETKQNQDSVLS